MLLTSSTDSQGFVYHNMSLYACTVPPWCVQLSGKKAFQSSLSTVADINQGCLCTEAVPEQPEWATMCDWSHLFLTPASLALKDGCLEGWLHLCKACRAVDHTVTLGGLCVCVCVCACVCVCMCAGKRQDDSGVCLCRWMWVGHKLVTICNPLIQMSNSQRLQTYICLSPLNYCYLGKVSNGSIIKCKWECAEKLLSPLWPLMTSSFVPTYCNCNQIYHAN